MNIEVSRFLDLIHIRLVCLDMDVAVNDKGCWVLCAISKVLFIVYGDFYSIASSA